ncbi:hypothetical protein L3Q67_45085 (plasmid) [Saccharothrix sp. AJ9571]|nr:hypothetical protein L3Q67_45085 [Saccharothrix sp. AJ9571]
MTDVVLTLAVLTALYLVYAWHHPYTACAVCEGGKRHDHSGRFWRECRRCSGSGAQLRLLRRMFGTPPSPPDS